MADLPIELPKELADRLALCLDVEGKIPRALNALGPLEGRDVVLLDGQGGLRARQLVDLGARLTVVAPEALSALSGGGKDALVSLWSGFRDSNFAEVTETERVLRSGGRLLVVHDYGRDDVSRLRAAELPEYGAWSRRDGWFLQNGFKLRVIHCWWTWQNLQEAREFLEVAFGQTSAAVVAAMRRPRLSYNIAIYHRSKAGQSIDEAGAALAGRA